MGPVLRSVGLEHLRPLRWWVSGPYVLKLKDSHLSFAFQNEPCEYFLIWHPYRQDSHVELCLSAVTKMINTTIFWSITTIVQQWLLVGRLEFCGMLLCCRALMKIHRVYRTGYRKGLTVEVKAFFWIILNSENNPSILLTWTSVSWSGSLWDSDGTPLQFGCWEIFQPTTWLKLQCRQFYALDECVTTIRLSV